jgi:WhiB family transcriptional regulator, redox-sensing transcriptional regulator
MDWRHEAACLEHDPEIFFPSGATGPVWQELERAKAVCRPCPVRAHCLQWALDTGQDSGVWGGLSEGERHRCRRRHGGGDLRETG